MGIPDAVIVAPLVQPPTVDSLQEQVHALRHVYDVRLGEIHHLSLAIGADVEALRAGIDKRFDRSDYALTGLVSSVARLEHRLIPAAWAGVATGLAIGALVTQLLQVLGRT